MLARTQQELRGIQCGDLELEEPDREQIVVSRTFGRDVEDPFDALATFAWRSIDPELSDLVQFKHEIYRYILNPGRTVVAAHEHHVAETSPAGPNNSFKPNPLRGSA